MENKTENDTLIEAAFSNMPQTVDGCAMQVLPPGYAIVSLEHQMSAPTRARAQHTFEDEASFVAYFNKHNALYSPGNTPMVFFSEAQAHFTAIFDAMEWREDLARYHLQFAPEWKTWTGCDHKAMSQIDFSRFIEDNSLDIITPDGATMLEIANRLEAKKSVHFSSSVRLATGAVEFTYVETVQGTDRSGKMEIPETFVISIPVYERGLRWSMTARLRYRIPDGGGKLSMWYDLLRPHDVKRMAMDQIVGTVGQALPVPIYFGSAGQNQVELIAHKRIDNHPSE